MMEVGCVCFLSLTHTKKMPSGEQEQQSPTPCHVAALKACLETHKGDQAKCAREIEAFKTACGGGGSSGQQAAAAATAAADAKR